MSGVPLVCAVDIGTSSVRAAFIDPLGRTVAECRTSRRDAAAQFDAEALWRDVSWTLRSLTKQAAEAIPASLAIAGHVGTVVLDSANRPLVPAGSWSDERGVGELRELATKVPEAWRRSGRVSVTGGALAVLAWLATHDPATAGRVSSVFAPKDFINLRLTGARITDLTSAAYTLALDVYARSWNGGLVAAAGLAPEMFPDLRQATDVIGTVSREAAAATGLPEGLPVAAGGPDGTVGAAAILGTDSGSIVDIAGTTDVLVQVTTHPVDSGSEQMVVNPYLVDGLWSQGGPTGMTGGSVAHCAGIVRPGELAEGLTDSIAAAVAATEPGSDGLLALPHFTGSRFPVWRDDERAAMVGWTLAHRPEHFIRAMQEGAAFAVREAIDVIDPSGTLPVLLAGGVAKSRDLVQIRADVFGRDIRTRTAPDASLLGAGRLAQVAVGIHSSLAEASDIGLLPTTAVSPRLADAGIYENRYAEWQSVRRALLGHRSD
jgi:xylulokinase